MDGLYYLHQLNIVHGKLSPDNVIVLNAGQALITDLDAICQEQGSNLSMIHYAASELSLHDDSRPTKATDIWVFACLSHKVLSEKVPFCQFTNDLNMIAVIARGEKPARPAQEGWGGNEISDVVWHLLSLCWEYDTEDHPNSSQVQEVLSHLHIEDDCPEPRPMIELEVLKSSVFNPKSAKIVLMQVLGSHQPSLQVPKHLCNSLFCLVHDHKALNTTTMAAKRLTPDDTQTLVDFDDLVIKDLPYVPVSNFAAHLLSNITTSMHIFPQYYKFIARHLAFSANVSHAYLLLFHGVFHESPTEPPQLCVVFPYLKNGTLEDYAPSKILNALVNGLTYMQNTLDENNALTGQTVVISDEG
ncbi:Receptor-interacting serine/threonine-protein kinase 1 [Leucoagaricus sp. SymC.cos]|nr:Receptor-interacting serine/threonine-protein kinase 1 [Leucoagaricus sp. SymC.cos]